METHVNQDLLFVDGLSGILVQKGALKQSDAQAAQKAFSEQTAMTFEEFLLDEELVTKEALLEALSVYYDLPAVDVMGIFFDHHLLRMFPKDVMLRNGFIPYERDGDVLMVIAAQPNNHQLPEIIGKFVSYDVTFMVGILRDIDDMVKEFYDGSPAEIELQSFEDTRDEHESNPLEDSIHQEDEE